MKKIEKAAATILAPVPAVMVSCDGLGFHKNIITLAWVGTVCSNPPTVSISIRPERYSYAIIRETKEFVINMPDIELVQATDFCGVVSGRDVDKFSEAGLTAAPGKFVKAPLIEEAPVNIECRVKQIIPLGSHDLFLAEVLLIHVGEEFLGEKGQLDLEKMRGVAYGNGHYHGIGSSIGTYGFMSQKGH